MSFDSAAGTIRHIERVAGLLGRVVADLQRRSRDHDASKLQAPEKPLFDAMGPQRHRYGDPAYDRDLDTLRVALEHHYRVNAHHPQHYSDGVYGMSLLDLVEMLCDWKATADVQGQPFAESMEVSRERFGIRDDLFAILVHTARDLGFLAEAAPAPETELSETPCQT